MVLLQMSAWAYRVSLSRGEDCLGLETDGKQDLEKLKM